MLAKNRGDTIIEVLLAVTLFSLVSVGTMTVMNQGMNTALRALEVTQVKQQVNAQAEALRAARKAHFAAGTKTDTWSRITGAEDHTSASSNGGMCTEDIATKGGFALNGRDPSKVPLSVKSMNAANTPVAYSQVRYSDSGSDSSGASTSVDGAYGIWIDKELVSDRSNTGIKAYDFTVHACWYGSGLEVPMTVQTVVRLYDD